MLENASENKNDLAAIAGHIDTSDKDITEFQKFLNKRFEAINKESDVSKTSLDIVYRFNDKNIIMQLVCLDKINTLLKSERINLTAAWVTGVCEIYGDVYTVIDLNMLINAFLACFEKNKLTMSEFVSFLTSQKTTINYFDTKTDTSLLLFKEYAGCRFAANVIDVELLNMAKENSLTKLNIEEGHNLASTVKDKFGIELNQQQINIIEHIRQLKENRSKNICYKTIDETNGNWEEAISLLKQEEEGVLLPTLIDDVVVFDELNDGSEYQLGYVVNNISLLVLLSKLNPF